MPNVVRNDLANAEGALLQPVEFADSQNNPQLAEVSDSSSLLAPRSLSEATSEVGENLASNGLSPHAGDPLVKGGFKVKGGSSGGGSISFINATTGGTETSSSVASVSSSAFLATTGNAIIAVCRWGTGGGTVTVTDTAGNTYSNVGSVVSNPSTNSAQMFVATNIVGNSNNSVTCNFSSNAQYTSVSVAQYSGIDVSNPVDVTTGTTGNSSSALSGTFNTSQANELIVAFASTNGGTFISTGNIGGVAANERAKPVANTILEDRIVSSIQSGITAAATLGATNQWTVVVGTFRGTDTPSTPAPLPTPTPTPLPTPTPVPSPTPTPPPVSGNQIYIAQNSIGSGNGSSCANALPVSFFNTTSNWASSPTSGKISPGTTVHLCGTITSQLTVNSSGSSGNPITIYFESGANISVSPGCNSSGCLNLGPYNYLTIDGAAACGWNTAINTSEGLCNGKIRNMLYGSSDAMCPGGPCTTQADGPSGDLIKGSGSHVEIRNLEAGPSYIHTTTGNNGNDYHGTGCISNNNGSDWNIHNNKLHDGGWCVTVTWSSGTVSNVTMTNNEFYNNSHMVALAGANAGNLDGFTFNGNYTHDMYMWDTTSVAWHADAIHLFGGSGTAKNLVIHNNIFGGNTGSNITGQIFTEGIGATSNIILFNNVFNITSNPPGGSNYHWASAQCTSCAFYNNTLNGGGTSVSLGYSTYQVSAPVENNIIEGAYSLFNLGTSNVNLSPFDYNAYGPNSGGIWKCLGSFYNNLASWKSACGEGGHSLYNGSSLGLDSTLKPQSGSPVIGAGVNVCTANPAFCTNYPAIKNDIAGNPRPASGPWDIGAYQFALGGTTPTPVPPPSPSFGVSMGDLNLDHIVNTLDFSLMNSKWLQNFPAYDLFVDGLINSLDYAILSSNWLKIW